MPRILKTKSWKKGQTFHPLTILLSYALSIPKTRPIGSFRIIFTPMYGDIKSFNNGAD